MASGQDYKKQDPNGNRFDFHGINTVSPPDAMPAGKYPYAQNIRRYLHNQIIGRATQAAATFTLAAAITCLRRMNDTSGAGPMSGYVLIVGSSTNLYANSTQVVSGLSGNKISIIPFRPNTSPPAWAYCSDSSMSAVLTASGFACAGMVKVRSDGLAYKTGIAEPQLPPTVSASSAIVNGNVTVPSTTEPWSVAGGKNPSYPYIATGGTAPVVITGLIPGATLQLTASGTIDTSYGTGLGAGDIPPLSQGQGANYPGGQGNIQQTSYCNVLMGAFTDSLGNVVTPASSYGPWTVGSSATLLVPIGATQFQLGIDDVAYGSGSGSLLVSYTITTQAVSSKVSLLGNVTAYYWGDSPVSGPVAAYVWNNPSDPTYSANPRTLSTAIGSTTNNSLIFDPNLNGDSNPMEWTTLDTLGNTVGTVPVFSGPLSDMVVPGNPAFANWNMIVLATLYIPAAGSYTFTVVSKDNIMWGIGGGATWSGKGTLRGNLGQSITVVNKADLLPWALQPGNSSSPASQTVTVSFPAAGDYSLEIDYDYWDRGGRSLVVTCAQPDGSTTIVPLPTTVLQNTSYRFRWRSTATGARSNPSPPSPQNQTPVQVSTITPQVFDPDPQVDVYDVFRQDTGLDNFTYVGTGPNTNPPTAFVDESIDTDLSGNELLEYDLFEPFPSIDLPRKGVVNVTGNTVTWVSGDKFNIRWLGGSLIKIAGIEYALYNRPTSTTSLTIENVNNGNNLSYEIDAATLAAQPTASTWGPTEQGGFMFGLDPNNPGDVVFTNGEDPDTAADTNRITLGSPSEPMMNGCLTDGIPLAFSTERSWFLYPVFTSANATVTGTQGSPWNPVLTGMTRGLYIRTCLAVAGGGLVFFRVKDGISVSEAGAAEQSITDEDLFNLFTHEGVTPSPVTLGGFTIYPPDDTKPELQSLSYGNGYLYYNYVGTDNNPHTLVYDVAAHGWVPDVYADPVIFHSLEEGQVNQTLVGCSSGAVRPLVGGAAEAATCVIATPAMNAGEARQNKTIGDIFMKASPVAAAPVTVAPYSGRYANALTNMSPTSLTGTGASAKYILDFTLGQDELDDIELIISWLAGKGTAVELWQPTWTDCPDTIQDRATDWTDCGTPGAKLIQGLLLEANTFNVAKSFSVQASDDMSLHVPDQVPITLNGQSFIALTFTPPFIAHSIRIVSSDSVNWQQFGVKPVFVPYPELVPEFQTEPTSNGQIGWQTIGEITLAHISTADLVVTFVYDQWPTQTITIPNSGGAFLKGPKMPMPPNKFKMVTYRVSSTAPFRLFRDACEVKVGQWGRSDPYKLVNPFGGPSDDSAVI